MNQDADAAGIARVSDRKASARKPSRLLLWAGGATAVAVCLAILLMWGVYGSGYLLDLVAAYCL